MIGLPGSLCKRASRGFDGHSIIFACLLQLFHLLVRSRGRCHEGRRRLLDGDIVRVRNIQRRSRRCRFNNQMRRILNQAANAAVKRKGSIFEIVYRRLVPRLGHNKAIGVIAHRLCRLIWIILHNGVHYEERDLQCPNSPNNAIRQE
jgi:hypothetical protein